MSATQNMTAEAEAAAQRYELLVAAWRSLYQAALSDATFGSQRQFVQVINDATAMGQSYVSAEEKLIPAAAAKIALEAQTATLQSLSSTKTSEQNGAAGEHVSASSDFLIEEIALQVTRDVAMLRQALRKAYITVSQNARAQNSTKAVALAHYRMGDVGNLNFVFTDRRHARWVSRIFIRTAWRKTLLTIYNETVLAVLADHGITQAMVVTDNPHSLANGTKISLIANTNLPTYAEIQDIIFQPNADAVLGVVA
jgi:hypothetical protein